MAPNAALHVALLAACGLAIDRADAYVPSTRSCFSTAFQPRLASRPATALQSTPTANGDTASASSSASSSSVDEAFSAFADSLDEETLFDDEDGGVSSADNLPTWQESLDSLLDPTTPAAKRQILLSDLLNASDDIQKSVQDALAKRNVSDAS